ncbi:MAG: hypothetical protein ACXWLS_12860, partial [Myxococcaceae bacterium]
PRRCRAPGACDGPGSSRASHGRWARRRVLALLGADPGRRGEGVLTPSVTARWPGRAWRRRRGQDRIALRR